MRPSLRAHVILSTLLVAIEGAHAETPVETLRGAVEVGVGIGFACARTESGAVLCWGESNLGHLGHTKQSLVPVQIPLPGPARHLWVDGDFPVCAELASDGSLWCWGAGKPDPQAQRGIERSPGIVELRRSLVVHCALLRDGTVRCAALAESVREPFLFPLPPGGDAYAPVVGVNDAVQLEVGESFACVRTQGGTVRCWGRNDVGQLGTTTRNPWSDRPVMPRGLEHDVQALALLDSAACAGLAGAVRCWGAAGIEKPVRFGRTPVTLPVPSPVQAFHRWVNGVEVLLADGTIVTWGFTALGDGKFRRVAQPTRVAGISGATQMSGVVALFTSTPAGWLCRGGCTSLLDATPVGPAGLPHDASPPVQNAAAGVTCAMDRGEVLCRGANNKGQLGDGTTVDRRVEWRAVRAPVPTK